MRRIPFKTVLKIVAKLAVAYLTPGKVDDVALAASIIHSGVEILRRRKDVDYTEAEIKEALDLHPDLK